MGAATAGAGMAKSYAGFRQDEYNTDLANARLKSNYLYDRASTDAYNIGVDRINAFKDQTYQADLGNIREAYNLGIYKNALNYREQVDEAAFTSLGLATQAAGAGGNLLAKGLSGRSAMLEDNQVSRMLGQQNTMIENNLMRARFATNLANDDLFNRTKGLQNQAYQRRGLNIAKRMGPMRPIYQQGPSTMGLVANMGGDALSGFGAGMGFQENITGIRQNTGNPDFFKI